MSNPVFLKLPRGFRDIRLFMFESSEEMHRSDGGDYLGDSHAYVRETGRIFKWYVGGWRRPVQPISSMTVQAIKTYVDETYAKEKLEDICD